MRVTDRQVRKLMMEYQKCGEIQKAALKADMHRETAAKYIQSGMLPSECCKERHWRTRADPFKAHWAEAEAMLRNAPELEAKALFDWLSERHPGEYDEGQLRSFQRHVRRWRALSGPEKEVYFPQVHRPGVRMQTDFTHANSLGVTIRNEPFEHLLCHSVLTYSNWQWCTICQSESLLALRHGLQAVVVQLGHLPEEHWTDHSTAATHELGGTEKGHRGFNRNYLKLMDHFGIEPRTINRSQPHENGDVESANGALKRRLNQHLLLRGSRNFESLDDYRRFIEAVFHKANRNRQKRLAEELAVMRPWHGSLLPEYTEEDVLVSRWSTIHADRRSYSVPSRLMGETVRLHRYEDRIEVYLAGIRQMVIPRLTGEKKHAINYRHVIEWLVRKPGAFAQYRFHADLFPSLVFRRAYDRLQHECPQRTADLEYLRILRQAAQTMESEVECALMVLEEQNMTPRWQVLLDLLAPSTPVAVPELQPLRVTLNEYDVLFEEVRS